MKVERIFVDVPELQRLEEQVDLTAATVSEWKSTIAKITTEFNIATLALHNARQGREKHALAAAMHDAYAVSEIKHARSAEAEATAKLADFAIALPAAEEKLTDAEKVAASARHSLAMLQAEKLMRQRVAAAAELDSAFAAAAAAYDKYAALGREIQNFPDLNFGSSGNMSHWEGVTGFRRIAAAVPAFFIKLFPGNWSNNAPRSTLALSEQQFWQLPPEPADKAKAA